MAARRPVVIGRAPNENEKAWLDARAYFAPAKTFEKLDARAEFVFKYVGVVTVLLTGLGLFTDLNSVLESTPNFKGVPIPVGLLALSLILAVVALLPFPHRNVDHADVDKAIASLKRKNLRIGLCVLASLVLFAFAIGTAATITLDDVPASKDPSISTSLAGVGEKATITATVEASDLSSDTEATTEVVGITTAGDETTLFHSAAQPDAAGTLKVAASVDGVGAYERFEVRSTLAEDGETFSSATAEISR